MAIMKRRRRTSFVWRQQVARISVVATLTVLTVPVAAHAVNIALGEYLSSECVTCHQLSGHATGGIPPIIGLAEVHFIEALQAYKSGERDNEVMRNIAGRLTAEEMSALAAYFARHSPKQK
jgi:cytochrome c